MSNYKCTEEHRKNLSLSHKGQVAWSKGKHLTDEHKQKISIANAGKTSPNKGRKMSDEQKTKIRNTLLGRKHTEESKRKLSEKLMGHKAWNKGLPAWNKGIPSSDETKMRLSESHKGKLSPNKGKKLSMELRKKLSLAHGGPNADIRKNMRNSLEYANWRTNVFALDNYTCQKCDQFSGKLNAHHIANFQIIFNMGDSIVYDLNNGITFCRQCHALFHKIYGKTNNTKEQLMEFLK